MSVVKPHGTRARYDHGCKCIYCTRWSKDPVVGELRWSMAPLLRQFPLDRLREEGYAEEDLQDWIANGIPDFTADCLCCALRTLPFAVWGPGWDEASNDFYREVDDEAL